MRIVYWGQYLDQSKRKWLEAGAHCIRGCFISCMLQEMQNAYNILVGKPEGKRPFRRPRHRW